MRDGVRFGVRLTRAIAIPPPPESIVDGYYTAFKGWQGPNARMPAYADITPYDSISWMKVVDAAKECERLGYDSIIVPDHNVFGRGHLESWTTLSALSAVTEKIKLGTLVLCVPNRYPSILAKSIATLDYISGGRLFPLGLGTGYMKEEFEAYGIPFPPYDTRIQLLRETVEIMKLMFTQEEATYDGKLWKVRKAVCEPKPLQKPFPICIGGDGKKILDLAAEQADVINISGDPETCRKRMQIVKERCSKIGRDFDDILFSLHEWFWIYSDEKERKEHSKGIDWMAPGAITMGTPEECIRHFQAYVDIGIRDFGLRFEDLPSLKGLRTFAEEVIPAFR